MSSSDDVVRAEARALIRVLRFYKLDREWRGPTPIWQDLEAFGNGASTLTLHKIGRDHGGTASAAFSAGLKLKAPSAALYLALASFTRASPAYRFLDASRWMALSFAFERGEAVADISVQREVLERLEATFEEEMQLLHCRPELMLREYLEDADRVRAASQFLDDLRV
jgi:hypothetical protein